jgi:hypothetical protein
MSGTFKFQKLEKSRNVIERFGSREKLLPSMAYPRYFLIIRGAKVTPKWTHLRLGSQRTSMGVPNLKGVSGPEQP